MDFATAFDAALDTFAQAAGFDGVGERSCLEPWRALAHRSGPTRRVGPHAHDLLAPACGVRAMGINVFGHAGLDVWTVARDWSAANLGLTAEAALTDLRARLPDRVTAHAGCARDAEGWRLKLWLGGPDTAAAAGVLGLSEPDRWRHVGVDLRGDGLGRARGYRRIRDAVPDWEGSAEWTDTARDSPGTSHRVLASLGTIGAPDSKRSFDLIFRPDAALSDLWHEIRRCTALGIRSGVDRHAVERAADRVAAVGGCLRPAAHEVDVYADGRVETDVLLTVGELQVVR